MLIIKGTPRWTVYLSGGSMLSSGLGQGSGLGSPVSALPGSARLNTVRCQYAGFSSLFKVVFKPLSGFSGATLQPLDCPVIIFSVFSFFQRGIYFHWYPWAAISGCTMLPPIDSLVCHIRLLEPVKNLELPSFSFQRTNKQTIKLFVYVYVHFPPVFHDNIWDPKS